MTTVTISIHAQCPTHGVRTFVRSPDCHWWECPEIGMLEPGSCGSVIPDEEMTPDGGDVFHWRQSRWVNSHLQTERRVWDRPRPAVL